MTSFWIAAEALVGRINSSLLSGSFDIVFFLPDICFKESIYFVAGRGASLAHVLGEGAARSRGILEELTRLQFRWDSGAASLFE